MNKTKPKYHRIEKVSWDQKWRCFYFKSDGKEGCDRKTIMEALKASKNLVKL